MYTCTHYHTLYLGEVRHSELLFFIKNNYYIKNKIFIYHLILVYYKYFSNLHIVYKNSTLLEVLII